MIVRKGNHCDRKSPAATTLPTRVVNLQRGAEDFTGIGGEEIPCHGQVARRIAHPHTTEVDHGAEFGETYQATKLALADLAMPIRHENHQGMTGEIESSIEDGTHVTISLEEKPRIQVNRSHVASYR